MRKERKARIVTVAVLAVAAAVALGQKNGWKMPEFQTVKIVAPAAPKPDSTPQDTIYAMLDAARAGDVPAYMASYTGQMSTALQQSLAETTPEAFSKYLKDSNAAIKGVALSEPQSLTDREVRVRVEYVYQDRNEAQSVYLEKAAGGWKIARVDGAERVKTLVPYGTPVQ
jgi:ketosteroid isomerase-like protein